MCYDVDSCYCSCNSHYDSAADIHRIDVAVVVTAAAAAVAFAAVVAD